ncbi:MAG: branched-chain amino acid ABC transporter permease [Rhodoblastus sp.]
MILSGNPPRGKFLIALLVLVVGALALAPFLFPGAKPLNVAAKICVFALLVASYDLLLGYSGIVSFAHTMFFGIGAYGVALTLYALGPSWGAILMGLGAGIVLAGALALAIGLFSLRVQTIFFAMVTLAVASAFAVLASQMSWLTGGEDGRTFRVPEVLRPGYRLIEDGPLGLTITGRTLSYYLVFVSAAVLFLVMLRIVESPFGRVLQAIRENPFRAEALGYRIVGHRTMANVLGAVFAACAGALNAIWLRYIGPDTTLSFNIMIDILLIVVIGGMGTLYGAIIGAALFVLAENYLQTLMGAAFGALNASGAGVVANFFNPDRWLLWLGLLFILSVYFFPSGIVGKLRAESKS